MTRAGWIAVTALPALACVPTLPRDPVPEVMEFDPQGAPPRVPQPIGLLINPTTGLIDLRLAGLEVPADCATSTVLTQAECEFDQYLQTLDGFPTVTPALAPASAALSPDTYSAASGNVVVVAAKAATVVSDLQIGFQPAGRYLTLRPRRWPVNESFWVAVRGYADGVKTTAGAEVVGAPTHSLLKQETSLTCGAADASAIPDTCPALALLSQQMPPAAARGNLVTLESIRAGYQQAQAWQAIAAAGIPKEEVAVMWGFRTHSNSVAELDPGPAALIVPSLPAPNTIVVAVQGPVDPATVSASTQDKFGSVVIMDLTAAAAGDLVAGLPRVEATYTGGNIVITAPTAFAPGHQIGLFFTDAIRDPAGKPLVASPVSKLLTLRGALTTATGGSALSSVSDADAAMLEEGRKQLAGLFDNPLFQPLTGISREALIYCFAFAVPQ